MKRIALFNHKGGVSKTTTTFNLGWMLARKGKRVILVDADPQCNLTGLVLGPEKFENFYTQPTHNIKDNLRPAFKAQPKLIEPVDCQIVQGVDNLFLLPGHLGLSEYEVTLGIAQQLSNSIFTLQNIPGAFSYLFNKTAEKYQADYVLIDMNPSLSAINQNLLMTSDYFIVPTSPDYFSIMALESMATVLPNWARWAQQAASTPVLTEDATYPFPKVTPKFLGIIIQRYLSYSDQHLENRAAKSVQKWIDKIKEVVKTKLVDAFRSNEADSFETLLLPHYDDYCLAEIEEFRTLIALSHTHQRPVFELASVEGEKIQPQQKESSRKFQRVFSKFAGKVIKLTDYESGA